MSEAPVPPNRICTSFGHGRTAEEAQHWAAEKRSKNNDPNRSNNRGAQLEWKWPQEAVRSPEKGKSVRLTGRVDEPKQKRSPTDMWGQVERL